MTDINWDQVNVEEGITEKDLAQSADISVKTPVGKFLCTVISAEPIEKTFKAYSCYAAKLQFRIDDVVEIEKPVFDDGKAVMRNGEQILKKFAVEGDDKAEVNNLLSGQFLFDEVNLYHVDEKEAIKNRRLYVARKIGIISDNSQKLTGAMWQNAVGCQVIVENEWNHWKDKITDEPKKNVKVAWAGYEAAGAPVEPDFSGI